MGLTANSSGWAPCPPPNVAHLSRAEAFYRIPDLPGPNYIRFAASLHAALRPTAYIELGTGRGDMLRNAHCRTVAVDPVMDITAEALSGKPVCHLFRQDPDVFFRENDAVKLLGRPIDLAFLSGPRLFERMLRAFAAVERCCRRDSVVLLHDCIPTDSHIARRFEGDDFFASRSPHPSRWAGDVWKAAALLQRHRPDLRICAFDTQPTGLLAVTNLDPASTVLEDRYFTLVREGLGTMTIQDDLPGYFRALEMLPAEEFATAERLSGLFVL